jgi:hypothetical protein
MLQSVQGMPQHQGLRLAHAQLLLSGAEGTDHEVKSPWPRPRSRRAAARGKPARGIG